MTSGVTQSFWAALGTRQKHVVVYNLCAYQVNELAAQIDISKLAPMAADSCMIIHAAPPRVFFLVLHAETWNCVFLRRVLLAFLLLHAEVWNSGLG